MRQRNVFAMCAGKVPYPTKSAAIARMESQTKAHRCRKQGNWGKRVMRPYHCPNCHSWHVGGSDERERARREWASRANMVDEQSLLVIPEAMLVRMGWGR